MSTLICFALKEEAAPFRKIAAGRLRVAMPAVGLKIAQRFSAGFADIKNILSPGGTTEPCTHSIPV
jgi:hypothetical protein